MRRHPQRFGRRYQIGFVPGQEIKHRAQHRRIAKPGAQFAGRKPGQRQQPVGAAFALQQPPQRCEREGLGILRQIGGGWRLAKNCQELSKGIEPQLGIRATGLQVAKRILVVEDNDLNRKLFCDVLKSQGFAVEPVADGRLALERAREFVPSLIIMDIQLADVSGVELIERAKADPRLRAIPVLAVTAYAGKGDEERIRDAGAEGYLAKPVSIGPFLKAVRGLLDKAVA